MSAAFLVQNRQKGFTLIEVMVTLVIISVGMLALGGLLITGVKVNSSSESRIDASGLAQGIMSRVSVYASAAGYSQAQATADARAMLAGRYDAAGAGGNYNPTVILNPTPTVAGGFTSIIVRLQWLDHGKSKQIELRSGVVTQ